ncbi:MAG: putative bifunctional diguanylate cyclase/phosphodiesterase [Actinomycetota bacterium]
MRGPLRWPLAGCGAAMAAVVAPPMGGPPRALVVLGLMGLSVGGLIRAHARLENRLVQTASHDPLTGLPNRTAFGEALRQALARRHPPDRGVAVVITDLDAFRAVNDTHGPAVGDALLCELADRLRRFAHEAAAVARLGGDEFALVLHDADVGRVTDLAGRLVDSLARPATVADVVIVPVVRLGVHVPEAWEGEREVVLRADAALQAAKAAGLGFELFDAARHRPFIDRYQVELQMRTAPDRGELVLHYQPVIDLATRHIVGAEALVRWNHPTRGLLGPAAFIEIAEESGAIVDVGRWVLRQACADARSWQARIAGAAHVGVAVNVSRRQLRNTVVLDDVRQAITGSGLSPASLTVEITETAMMRDASEMLGLLGSIKQLGVQLAMDDFGTGYSSMAQLRAMPVDVVKVDKAFVDGIAREEGEWALAAAVIRLAGSLGKRTLAEGVEHPSQVAHLRALGCEQVQGFLFSRPLPLAEFERLLARQAAGDPPPSLEMIAAHSTSSSPSREREARSGSQ